MRIIQLFTNLSFMGRSIVCATTGGVVLGSLAIMGMPTQFLLLIAAGMILVGLLVLAFQFLMARRQKGKGSAFLGRLMGAASGSPAGVSDPAMKARLDALRKTFEDGVSKYTSAGKDLYALPWYLIVGPSGSGKTEAIRHCNVGFPPNLQNYLQGAGGTLNMHWWFTNHAVIIDTAGKMFMEKAGDSQSGAEWREFLSLLKVSRPLQPINGMLLAIGADSLIKDSADEIQEKAARIASQLDVIQRTLEVRFPVFVIVTKCDLITGFREYFGKINDPQLQHQMMGWSNPSSLDEAFNPEKVTEHLESVRERLLKRRMGLLADPVHTEDPMERRVEQVDAMYALPDSFTKLGSRLRRYLELIFVAGEWSPKPLFLRGIYFTSSMQEGAELDADLASALGISVSALPEGGIFKVEKSYFLRDLFMAKVFKEKGLVTRAANVSKQQAGRRRMLLGVGMATVVLLMALTFLGWQSVKKSTDEPAIFWNSVQAAWKDGKTAIVTPAAGSYTYTGAAQDVEIEDEVLKLTRTGLLVETMERSKARISPPLIFWPVMALRGDTGSGSFNSLVQQAHRSVVTSALVVPLAEGARARFATMKPEDWNDNATQTLAALLNAECISDPKGEKGGKAAVEGTTLASVLPVEAAMRFVLKAGEFDKAGSAPGDLQNAVDAAYPGGDALGWPPAELGCRTPASTEALAAGVGKFNQHWDAVLASDPALGRLTSLRARLEEFGAADELLLELAQKLKNNPPKDKEALAKLYAAWKEHYSKLEGAWKAIEPEAGKIDLASLPGEFEKAKKAISERIEKSFALLGIDPPKTGLAALAEKAAESADKNPKAGDKAEEAAGKLTGTLDDARWPTAELKQLRTVLRDRKAQLLNTKLASDVAQVQAFYEKGAGQWLLGKAGSDSRVVAARFKAYAVMDKALAFDVGTPAWGRLAEKVKSLQDACEQDKGVIKTAGEQADSPTGDIKRPMKLVDAGDEVMKLAVQAAASRALEGAVSAGAGEPGWVSKRARELADELGQAGVDAKGGFKPVRIRMEIASPQIAAVDFKAPAGFEPEAAERLFRDAEMLLTMITDAESKDVRPVLVDDSTRAEARRRRDDVVQYASKYFGAWTNGVLADVFSGDDAGGQKWEAFRSEMDKNLRRNADVTVEGLKELNRAMQGALGRIPPTVLKAAQLESEPAKWVEALKADLKEADDKASARGTQVVKWTRLGTTAAEAHETLGRLTGDEFLREYLDGFPSKPTSYRGPHAEFWAQLWVKALRCLSAELVGDRDRFLDRLDGLKQLPLVMERSEPGQAQSTVTSQDLAMLKRYMPPAAPGGGKKEGPDSPLRSGARTQIGAVDEQLSRLYGTSTVWDGRDRLIRAFGSWLPFLGAGDPENVPKVELFILPGDAARDVPQSMTRKDVSAARVRGIAVTVGGGKPSAGTDNEVNKRLAQGLTLPAGDRVRLEFYDTVEAATARANGDQAAAFGSRDLSTAWSIIELMAEPDAGPWDVNAKAPPASGVGDMWRVPVIFKASDGQQYFWWLGVKFTNRAGGPPDRKDWPTASAWNR